MKLHVSNMYFGLKEEDVHEAFSQFGQVESVEIVKDKATGKSKGIGFVVMDSAAEGQAAIYGLNDTELSGRKIRVSESRPWVRPEKPVEKKAAGSDRNAKGTGKKKKNRGRRGKDGSGDSREDQGTPRGGQFAFGGTRAAGKGGARSGQGEGRGGQGGAGGRGGQGRGR